MSVGIDDSSRHPTSYHTKLREVMRRDQITRADTEVQPFLHQFQYEVRAWSELTFTEQSDAFDRQARRRATMNDGVRKVEDITAREAAVLLMATIEKEGGTFQLARRQKPQLRPRHRPGLKGKDPMTSFGR